MCNEMYQNLDNYLNDLKGAHFLNNIFSKVHISVTYRFFKYLWHQAMLNISYEIMSMK